MLKKLVAFSKFSKAQRFSCLFSTTKAEESFEDSPQQKGTPQPEAQLPKFIFPENVDFNSFPKKPKVNLAITLANKISQKKVLPSTYPISIPRISSRAFLEN